MNKKINRRGFVSTASSVGAGLAIGLPSLTLGSHSYLHPDNADNVSIAEMNDQKLSLEKPWSQNDLRKAILDRTTGEKIRKELDVNYYRIGFKIAFCLPVAQRPSKQDLPEGIAGAYPWLTWLSWDLEKRWRTLHAAWRNFGDRAAGLLLQREMAALAGWDHFVELNNQVSLVTAHIAACLSLSLADESDWDTELLGQARSAASGLVERDVWPWFEKNWMNVDSYTPARLHNINVIALVRTAQLARQINSQRADVMETKMSEVLRIWCNYRTGKEYHTEGTAYDGYLMDNITEWMEGLPFKEDLLKKYKDAFRSLVNQWIDLTLPGRPDLHAPLGDVEDEMMFWMTGMVRISGWYGWSDAAWLLSHVPVNHLPTAAVSAAIGHSDLFSIQLKAPVSAPHEHPNAITLRTGWSAGDLAAFVSLSRNSMSHLQADGGHIVLGWQGRFWITDPGYQQYKAGEERNYTLGTEAHNCPVIDGKAQKTAASRLLKVGIDLAGWQHTSIDLTSCYAGLPSDAMVHRDVWLAPGDGRVVIVRDRFDSLNSGAEIRTHWLGDTHLAWHFSKGWVRLSDGTHSIWLGTLPDRMEPSGLYRHPGSRGPLTLTHKASLSSGTGARWWVLCCDPDGGWSPPSITSDGGRLILSHREHPKNNRSFGE